MTDDALKLASWIMDPDRRYTYSVEMRRIATALLAAHEEIERLQHFAETVRPLQQEIERLRAGLDDVIVRCHTYALERNHRDDLQWLAEMRKLAKP